MDIASQGIIFTVYFSVSVFFNQTIPTVISEIVAFNEFFISLKWGHVFYAHLFSIIEKELS